MNELTNLGFNAPKIQENNDLSSHAVQEAKGIAAIQASYIIAKKFPRNEHNCFMGIIESCKRPFLAEQACYAYPRGNQLVTGPSIRLAEVLAQKWTNCQIGIEIVSQNSERTQARAYANDIENNYMVDASFTVEHKRTTKKGVTRLTDERDIREMVANIGSRHLRGCILRVIPGDVVEAAVNQCKKTLETGELPLSDRIRIMVTKFDELGVKVEHLEKRLGHKLDATIPQEIVTLQGIFKAIKDGFSSREDFFDIRSTNEQEAKVELNKLLTEKNKKGTIENDKKQE